MAEQQCKHEKEIREFFEHIIYNEAEYRFGNCFNYLWGRADLLAIIQEFEFFDSNAWIDFLSENWGYWSNLADLVFDELKIGISEVEAEIIEDQIVNQCPNFYSIGAEVADEIYELALREVAEGICEEVFGYECNEKEMGKLMKALNYIEISNFCCHKCNSKEEKEMMEEFIETVRDLIERG